VLRRYLNIHAQDYASMRMDDFEPGCVDGELPAHLRRTMPDGALAAAAVPVGIDQVIVGAGGPDAVPVWRDHSADDEFLQQRHALFRLDTRGPHEIFDAGFRPRDPRNMDMGGHTGGNTNSGFVSLSKSPQHAVARDTTNRMGVDEMRGMIASGRLEPLPGGRYRMVHYLHEACHPYGIDVDATYHDASAHSRYSMRFTSNQEAEVLAPGGLRGSEIHRVWSRSMIFDSTGRLVDAFVDEPVYNPNCTRRPG
jgi:hypothetical protein